MPDRNETERLGLTPEPEGTTASRQPQPIAEMQTEEGTGASAPVLPAAATARRPIARGVPASSRRSIDFHAVNAEAIRVLPALVGRWLPQGHRMGREWVALNPRRGDQHLGSFRINLDTGRWADFATDDRGGDPVSLLAFLNNCSQLDAARDLAAMLGLSERQVLHG